MPADTASYLRGPSLSEQLLKAWLADYLRAKAKSQAFAQKTTVQELKQRMKRYEKLYKFYTNNPHLLELYRAKQSLPKEEFDARYPEFRNFAQHDPISNPELMEWYTNPNTFDVQVDNWERTQAEPLRKRYEAIQQIKQKYGVSDPDAVMNIAPELAVDKPEAIQQYLQTHGKVLQNIGEREKWYRYKDMLNQYIIPGEMATRGLEDYKNQIDKILQTSKSNPEALYDRNNLNTRTEAARSIQTTQSRLANEYQQLAAPSKNPDGTFGPSEVDNVINEVVKREFPDTTLSGYERMQMRKAYQNAAERIAYTNRQLAPVFGPDPNERHNAIYAYLKNEVVEPWMQVKTVHEANFGAGKANPDQVLQDVVKKTQERVPREVINTKDLPPEEQQIWTEHEQKRAKRAENIMSNKHPETGAQLDESGRPVSPPEQPAAEGQEEPTPPSWDPQALDILGKGGIHIGINGKMKMDEQDVSPYDKNFVERITNIAQRRGIDPNVLLAKVEDMGDYVSSTDLSVSRYMQINPAAAKAVKVSIQKASTPEEKAQILETLKSQAGPKYAAQFDEYVKSQGGLEKIKMPAAQPAAPLATPVVTAQPTAEAAPAAPPVQAKPEVPVAPAEEEPQKVETAPTSEEDKEKEPPAGQTTLKAFETPSKEAPAQQQVSPQVQQPVQTEGAPQLTPEQEAVWRARNAPKPMQQEVKAKPPQTEEPPEPQQEIVNE